MRTEKEWEKLSNDIKEEDFNLRLENPLKKLRYGAPLSESDSTILTEAFNALIKKVEELKLLNTLNENKLNNEHKPKAKNALTALTNKFIDVLYKEHDKNLSDRDDYLAGLNFAADTIAKLEKEAEFEEIARVMMKHLGSRTDLYHPHHTVIITSTSAQLVEGVQAAGQVMDYITD